jgi:hypothetical protein
MARGPQDGLDDVAFGRAAHIANSAGGKSGPVVPLGCRMCDGLMEYIARLGEHGVGCISKMYLPNAAELLGIDLAAVDRFAVAEAVSAQRQRPGERATEAC